MNLDSRHSLLYGVAAVYACCSCFCNVQLCAFCFCLFQGLFVNKDAPTGKAGCTCKCANKQRIYMYTLKLDTECSHMHAVRKWKYMLTKVTHGFRKAVNVLTCTC